MEGDRVVRIAVIGERRDHMGRVKVTELSGSRPSQGGIRFRTARDGSAHFVMVLVRARGRGDDVDRQSSRFGDGDDRVNLTALVVDDGECPVTCSEAGGLRCRLTVGPVVGDTVSAPTAAHRGVFGSTVTQAMARDVGYHQIGESQRSFRCRDDDRCTFARTAHRVGSGHSIGAGRQICCPCRRLDGCSVPFVGVRSRTACHLYGGDTVGITVAGDRTYRIQDGDCNRFLHSYFSRVFHHTAVVIRQNYGVLPYLGKT